LGLAKGKKAALRRMALTDPDLIFPTSDSVSKKYFLLRDALQFLFEPGPVGSTVNLTHG